MLKPQIRHRGENSFKRKRGTAESDEEEVKLETDVAASPITQTTAPQHGGQMEGHRDPNEDTNGGTATHQSEDPVTRNDNNSGNHMPTCHNEPTTEEVLSSTQRGEKGANQHLRYHRCASLNSGIQVWAGIWVLQNSCHRVRGASFSKTITFPIFISICPNFVLLPNKFGPYI